jgi:Domain of unknown function (DUF4440)
MNEEHFRRLEMERTRAIVARDMPAIENTHAPEYELITPTGRIFSRARYIELIAEAPFYSAWEHGPMQVRVTQAMAAVKYQATLSFPSGKIVECWHTDLYELRGSLWQAVWSQATQLPASAGDALPKSAA